MVWKHLGGNYVPQLKVYDDAWLVLSSFDDLLHELGNHDNKNITPKGFINILKAYGFKDLTEYDAPSDMKNNKDVYKLHNRLNEIELEVKLIRDKL